MVQKTTDNNNSYFEKYKDDVIFRGLTPEGFTNTNEPVKFETINFVEVERIGLLIKHFLPQTKRVTHSISSYGLKNIIEEILRMETDYQYGVFSNGTMILIMYDLGYDFEKEKPTNKNCFFNIPKSGIEELRKYRDYLRGREKIGKK